MGTQSDIVKIAQVTTVKYIEGLPGNRLALDRKAQNFLVRDSVVVADLK